MKKIQDLVSRCRNKSKTIHTIGQTFRKDGSQSFRSKSLLWGYGSGVARYEVYPEPASIFKEEVLSSISSIIYGHEDDLESVGITLSEDGSLEIDSEALTHAIDQDLAGAQEIFNELALEIGSFASTISSDSPLNYAREAEDMSEEFSDYIYSASTEMMKEILLGSVLNTYI